MLRQIAAVMVSSPPEDGHLLYERVYSQLRKLILQGVLRAGERVPSTRILARHLGVSRNTTLRAFERLHADGLLESHIGSGTYVPLRLSLRRPPRRDVPRLGDLSSRGRLLTRLPTGREQTPLPLTPSLPAIDRFPLADWRRVTRRVMESLTPIDLAYGDPTGYLPLRETIAHLLASTRGIIASADQILVTSSAQHGIDLALRLILDPGDAVIVESPNYPGFAGAIRGLGGTPLPVPMTSDGIDTSAILAMKTNARVACVTPSHQFPTGAVMSLARRRDLLAWAGERNGWIVEDDFEADLYLDCEPIPALYSLGSRDSVMYVSSFSRSVFPSLRIGFMVVPRTTAQSVIAARSFVDRQPATIPQMVLHRFIAEGHLGTHLTRMRALYRQRRDALCTALEKHLSNVLDVAPTVAGLHLVAKFRSPADDRACAAVARAAGLGLEAMSTYFDNEPGTRGLIIGFGNTRAEDADREVARLARALRSVRFPA